MTLMGMAEDMWNQDGGKKRQDEERRQLRTQDARDDRDRRIADEASGAFGHPGLEFAMGMHRQGMQNHANAAGAINSAIGQEMESRVAQQREMRRMAHEQEMMRLRAEAARREREGDIIRSLLNG